MKTTIDEVVEQISHVKEHGKKCSLLIGAGCSFSAGVPLAQGFVDLIKEKYPSRYEKASEKTYGACMKQLPQNVRRDLVAKSVDEASSINWAHVGIAQLVAHGYVDRVYTTNFDPLILRACALVNQFPAVYDFAAATQFIPDMVTTPAVFFLHGQRSGFKLLHTPEELRNHAEQIRPVFHKAGEGRMWIVVGYSGENDPLVELLATAPQEYGIYWVGFRDNEPAKSVRDALNFDGEERHWLPGYDADQFFIKLTQRLQCFPPDLMARPFSHLASTLNRLTRFTLLEKTEGFNPLETAKENVERAIQAYESGPVGTESGGAQEMDAAAMLMAGQYDELIELRPGDDLGKDPSLREPLAWAHVMKGLSLAAEAKTKVDSEADRFFEQAGQEYAEALRLKSEMHEALNNWGNMLLAQAETKAGAEADRLFEQAGQKYAEALRLHPNDHEVLNNWGNTLLAQARTKTGTEADRLFEQARQKYAEALRPMPDKHVALYNWGNTFLDQAKTKTGAEADRLFEQAGQKYAEALRFQPDDHEVLHNWGNTLLTQAETKAGAEADRLFEQASQKYAEALRHHPDDHEVLNNWGNTLLAQAKTKVGAEADHLFEQASQKYTEALRLHPNDHEVLNNWGNMLLLQARRKTGAEADRLFDLARGKLQEAERLKAGAGSYNLACVAALSGRAEECRQWLQQAHRLGTLPNRQHLLSDSDLESVRSQPWFSSLL